MTNSLASIAIIWTQSECLEIGCKDFLPGKVASGLDTDTGRLC